MLTRFWTFGLHSAGIVSLILQPQKEKDLPVNKTFDLTVNDSSSGHEGARPAVSILAPSTLASDQSDLGQARYGCDGTRYGQPHVDSCREAYNRIEVDQEVLKFGDRTEPDAVDVLLPLRISSSTYSLSRPVHDGLGDPA